LAKPSLEDPLDPTTVDKNPPVPITNPDGSYNLPPENADGKTLSVVSFNDGIKLSTANITPLESAIKSFKRETPLETNAVSPNAGDDDPILLRAIF